MKQEWTDLFQPKCLNDLILDDSLRKLFRQYITNKSIPGMTLYGQPGIGKTTLAKILIRELECQSDLFIAASVDNSVDTVKTKIKEFCDSVGFAGSDKIVLLDEADRYASSASVDALRNIIDSCSSDTRFILTCNYINRISPAVLSRCEPIQIKFGMKEILIKLLEILKTQNISYTKEDITLITKNIVQRYFPDIRRVLKNVERCCISGKFEFTDVNYEEELESIITFIIDNINDVRKCREYWLSHESMFGADYLTLGKALFNRIQTPSELILLGDRLYQMNLVLDKEIGFYMMVLELNKCHK